MEFLAIGFAAALITGGLYLFSETTERAYHERRHYQNHKRRLLRRKARRAIR